MVIVILIWIGKSAKSRDRNLSQGMMTSCFYYDVIYILFSFVFSRHQFSCSSKGQQSIS